MNGPNKKHLTIREIPEMVVMALLLFGFMGIVPLTLSRSDIRKLQRASFEDEHGDVATVICVSRDGQIWFGRDSVRSLSELQVRLSQRLNSFPSNQRNVYLKASPLLQYSEVLRVTDAIAAIGVKPINFVTRHLR